VSKTALILVVTLLVLVVVLQLLAALNIFPRARLVPVCPVNAIQMRNGKAEIDPGKCIGCQRCVIGVPGILTPVKEDSVAQALVPIESPADPVISDNAVPTKAAPDKANPTCQVKPARPQERKSYAANAQKCIGCGLCTLFCPEEAISLVDGKAVIDPGKCVNCGICKNGNGGDYDGCPAGAITAP